MHRNMCTMSKYKWRHILINNNYVRQNRRSILNLIVNAMLCNVMVMFVYITSFHTHNLLNGQTKKLLKKYHFKPVILKKSSSKIRLFVGENYTSLCPSFVTFPWRSSSLRIYIQDNQLKNVYKFCSTIESCFFKPGT